MYWGSGGVYISTEGIIKIIREDVVFLGARLFSGLRGSF